MLQGSSKISPTHKTKFLLCMFHRGIYLCTVLHCIFIGALKFLLYECIIAQMSIQKVKRNDDSLNRLMCSKPVHKIGAYQINHYSTGPNWQLTNQFTS